MCENCGKCICGAKQETEENQNKVIAKKEKDSKKDHGRHAQNFNFVEI